MKPRPHQTRTMQAIQASAARGSRHILVAGPTGSGKMFLIAMLMQSAVSKGNPCIFFGDQRELVQQCEVELRRLNVAHGTLISGYDNHNPGALCQVVAKDTLWARAWRSKKIHRPEASVIIFDEAHRNFAKTFKGIVDHYRDAFVLGFTATPCRTNGSGLGTFYDDLIVMATYKELQDAGYLVPIKLFAPSTPDLEGVKISRGDYAKGQLEERMDKKPLVGDIVRDWKKRASDRRTVAFASGVNHSIHIRNEFRRAGIRAEHLDGTTDPAEREDIIGATRDGNVDVLCNYGVVTTGVDLPILKCAIMARPTKSLIVWRQCLGRIVRPYGDYKDAIVLDHAGGWSRHGFPDADLEWDLGEGTRVHERRERAIAEKREARDFCCSKCQAVYKGPACPACGHKPGGAEKRVAMTPGELLEIKQAEARREATSENKQEVWNKCLGWAIGTNRKVGAAYHRYRERLGVKPANSLMHVPRGKQQWNMTAKDFYDQHVIPAKQGDPVT